MTLQLSFLLSPGWVLLCFLLIVCSGGRLQAAENDNTAFASVQGYTGLWDMPTARVLPDWSLRLGYGNAGPYSYYGGSLGLFNRLEFTGRVTGIDSVPQPFGGREYGDYKDRSVGAKLVLLPEGNMWPQVAVGAYDAYGTAHFAQRYLVASKKLFPGLDLSLGLGQGILGGETVESQGTDSLFSDFLLSSPDRPTKLFGGIDYRPIPDLSLALEYSSIDYATLKGGKEADTQLNFGLKYNLLDWLQLSAGLWSGRELALGAYSQFPLQPEGILAWKKEGQYSALERKRWAAYAASPEELAEIVAEAVKNDGYYRVEVACTETAVWVETYNSKFLSDPRSLGRLVSILNGVLPKRIQTYYLNLKQQGQVVQSLALDRKLIRAYLDDRLDASALLAYSDLSLYQDEHWQAFRRTGEIGRYVVPESWYSYRIQPKIKTLIEDPGGFFLHKGVLKLSGGLYPWRNGKLLGAVELPVFNEFDQAVNADPLEDNPAATGWWEYAKQDDLRMTSLAFDQTFPLSYDFRGRFSFGYFDTQYAGFSGETFRYFNDGLWGLGLQGEVVRKRAVNDQFKFRESSDKTFHTAFLNLYAQVWPEQGLEAGLKLGRFLAGDIGALVELRRSYKYFTIGAWHTLTSGGDFKSDLNKGHSETGVFIRIPFSIFRDHEARGHVEYGITGFQRDAGQTVSLPNILFPGDPWSTPDHTRRHIEDMKRF